jgi:phytoene desaturase
VRNPKLRVVLTFQSLLVGGNPFSTTSVYCLIAFLERRWGVHFAMGGTGSLVNGLVKLIEGQGNQVRCDQAVDKITVSDGPCATRRAAGQWRADTGRRGGVQRRFSEHLPLPGGARTPAPLDRQAH